MAIKKLDEVLAADEFVMPKYLIVKNDELNYFHVPAGQGVYHVSGESINAFELNEKGDGYKETEPVVTHAGDKILYIDKLHKDPIQGVAQPGKLDFQEGDDVNKALLDAFKRFVAGFYSVHAMVLVTDVLADIETPDTTTTTTKPTTTTTTTEAPVEGGQSLTATPRDFSVDIDEK